MSRTENIKLVDIDVIEDEGPKNVVSVNTTGNTPDRVELKEQLYRKHSINVDSMFEEVPCEIGSVTYSDTDEIIRIEIENWVSNQYQF